VTEGSSRNVGRTVAVSLVLALALMWIYVLFVANPENVDKLKSSSFGTQAQPVCRATIDRLSQLGLVNQIVKTPVDRAELVDKTDVELKAMVARLRTITVADADDAHAVNAWLADWDQWLADHAAWSAKLHQGENAQFFEKQRDNGAPNSKALNDFAQINSMPACATPGGV